MIAGGLWLARRGESSLVPDVQNSLSEWSHPYSWIEVLLPCRVDDFSGHTLGGDANLVDS